MSAAWATVAGLAIATATIKAFGPVVFGGRELPALLAALVITETFGGPGRSLVLDARAGGLVVAGIALWRRAPLYVVVLAAAAATALLRAIG